MSALAYKTISISGPDAFEFLQNLLTNDLGLLEAETEIFAALCNPKGRVIWFGTVSRAESQYTMSVAADLAENIVQRLTMFRFRSRVEFAIGEGGTVDAEFLIANGYPFIGAIQSELFTPHMLNLDLLGAISVDKGCYPGQEVVARTHFRGATKRRLMRFESTQPVSPGNKISDGERDIGEVLNVAGKELLAVVSTKSADEELSIDGRPLVNLALPYL